MKMRLGVALLGLAAAGGFSTSAGAAVVILDDFETTEGHFNLAPSFSGTTAGETETTPGVGPSTADRDTTTGVNGSTASQRIFIDDDPAADSPAGGAAWRLRHLSGSGTPANNVAFSNGLDSYVGYYLKTSTPNLRAGILLDDGAALELSTRTPIIADGEWHVYQWQLSDANQWDAFAGTGANGAIDAATATIDGIFVDVVKTTGDQDATFFLDSVSFSDSGPLPAPVVPEPASAGLLGLAGIGLLARRRRA
jgi:hypothetical protein